MVEVEWCESVHLDAYKAIRRSDASVKLYWGGRDSGKSYEIALSLIEKCLSAKRFKCILIRKTFNSIRDSQWELIKSIVYELGLEELFTFTRAPLEIKCANGNSFIARGCDNPHNIKSVTEPTDAWYEEADKLTMDEYTTVSTTLRSNDVRVNEWISFNPESDGDYNDHWLFKIVGTNYGGTYEWENAIDVENRVVDVKYCSCHTTFTDNPYCPDERRAKYIETTKDDDYLYTVYIRGEWGNREAQSPFCVAYNEDKHVAKTEFKHSRNTYVLVDFNYNPFACAIYQSWLDDNGLHVHQVAEISIVNGTIQSMADAINSEIGESVYSAKFGGDYNGNANKIGRFDNRSLYRELQSALGVSWNQFYLVSNPMHKMSRIDCNYFLRHFPDFKVGEHCTESRRDMRMVQIDAYGSIIKRNRKDESQRADLLDNFRYLVNTFFKKQIDRHKKSGRWL